MTGLRPETLLAQAAAPAPQGQATPQHVAQQLLGVAHWLLGQRSAPQ